MNCKTRRIGVSFIPAAFLLLGMFFSCQKPQVGGGDIEEAPVEEISVPSELSLKVGDKGSFEISYSPSYAVDAKVLHLSSSDEGVLKVTYEGLKVSYEALSAGHATVKLVFGAVRSDISVTVVDPSDPSGPDDPSSPVKTESGVRVELTPGIRSLEGPVEAASLKVAIEEGDPNGNYVISYKIDGGEPQSVRGIFAGQSRTFSLDPDLSLGQHSVSVDVTEEKNLSEPVSISMFFWVKGPALTSYSVAFTSEFGADFVLGAGSSVSLAKGESGTVWFRHLPATTPVVRSFDIPDFLQLDFQNSSSENGLLCVPFLVKEAAEGTMKVTFVNGDEEYVAEGAVDGKSSRPLGVSDYSVPEKLTIALDGGSQTYTFKTTPERAYNPEITELKSSDEKILKVSWQELTATFTPLYSGDVTVTVVLSGIRKEFPVSVTGNVVTDFTVPDGLEIVMGESADFTVEVTPMGALDAKVESLVCSDEKILKVKADGFDLHFDAIAEGNAKVSLKIGAVEKSFDVKVLSDEVSDYKVPEDLQLALGGGAQSYTFETTPKNPSNGEITGLTSSDEGILKVKYSGLTATFTPVYTGSVTVSVTIGGISKTFGVTVTGDVVTGFSVPQGLELTAGDVYDYVFEVTPMGALDARLESLESSDESVLRVSSNGLKATLTAVSKGSATVKVKIGKVEKSFDVKVAGLYVKDFEVPSDYEVPLGNSKSYTFVPTPAGASDATLNGVSSSDDTILKVEAAGGLSINMIPVYPGTATVSVTIGSVTKKFSVKVTGTVVTDFTVPDGLEIQRGEKAEFTMIPSPDDAVDKEVNSLKCSDESVLKVTRDGFKLSFEALKQGSADVTVVVGRKEKTFSVKVTPRRVTDFTVPTGFSVEMLSSKDYSIEVTPSDADDAEVVSVSSSDESVLKVSAKGLVLTLEGVYEGKADVKVKVGTVEKTFSVEVLGLYVKDFSVPKNFSVEIGHSETFTFVPDREHCLDAEIKSLKSSDESVLVVSYDGLTVTFKALYVGDVKVTAKVGSIEKTFSVSCTGVVVTGIEVPSEVSGQKLTYGATVNAKVMPVPADAYDASTMKVEALNPDVVSVTSLGNFSYAFKAVGFGDASFRVTCGRQTKTFSCSVPESISLTAGKTTVAWGESTTVKVSGVNGGWDWSASGAFEPSAKGQDDSPLRITLSGDTFTVENRSASRTSQTGTITVKTKVTGVTKTLNIVAEAVPDKNVVVVSPGCDEKDRVFIDVLVKAGSSSLKLNSLAFYIFSADAESEDSSVRSRARSQIDSSSPDGVLLKQGGSGVVAREYSFFLGNDVSMFGIYSKRFYLDEVVSSYQAEDSFGPYDDGFGMEGYLSTSTGKVKFSY